MPDDVLIEEPLQFGEGGRLFGILTLPSVPPLNGQELPVFVFLSAGLLHRIGPHRLHVRFARELAQMGFHSLRVDMAGTGDSPSLAGLTNQQSVAADFQEIMGVLEARLGRVPFVLVGLCSGADNAIMLTLKYPRIIGMVLLDPVCDPDDGFRARAVGFKARAFSRKCTRPALYVRWLKNRIKAFTGPSREMKRTANYLAIRDLPTQEQMRAAFEVIREREGRVLSVFTGHALPYYNQIGQMGRVLEVEGYEQYCTELFWPHVTHTYAVELHRHRLIEKIKAWAAGYVGIKSSGVDEYSL